jgi:hypothetical protein
MPLETDLNKVPYYDDFDETNNYYRILFRPATAVQARELTQMQSIQQDQIEKLGGHIFVDGSVIDGCSLSFDTNVNYLKLTDNYQNGAAVSTIDLDGKYLRSTSNLYAYVVTSYEGSEGSIPDLKTLYIKYTNSGLYTNGSQQSIFNADDTLTVYTSANVNFATVTVANSSMSPTGNGFVASISDGKIFHKGTFIRVAEQNIVVSKYDANPNNVSIGFTTKEEIITPEIDVSLLDNAQGSFNYNAPGSHRLKLTPLLSVRTTDSVSTTNTTNFFTIATFVDGKANRILTDPQYANLGNELARRTYEESGNYVVSPFNVTTGIKYSNDLANTTHLNAVVDKGIGYIHGYRVQFNDKNNIAVRKGNDVEYVESQTITGNFGNYVYVSEFSGVFNINQLTNVGVSLRDTTQASVSTGQLSGGTVQGNDIGTANIRTILYYSGVPGKSTAQYKVYLFNIKMNSGKTFGSVKSIYANSGLGKAFCDLVLESGLAVLKETNLSSLVLPLGKRAVRNLRNASAAPNDYVTQYNFRSANNLTFTQSQGSVGVLSVPTTGVGTSGQELPYSGGTLSATSELDFLIIATNSANTANLNGTVSTSGNVITGTGTFFANTSSDLYLEAGDFIYVANSTTAELRQITVVNSNTSLNVNTAFVGTFPTGAKVMRHIPTGSVVNMTKPTANIIVVSTSSANIYLGTTLNKDLDATAYYNLRRETAVGASKIINKNRLVKININTSNTTGPWSLGLPDIHKLRGIYQGNSTSTFGEYSTSNKNAMNNFTLDDGQRDDRYELGQIYLKPGYTLNSTDRLLIEVDHFTHSRSSGVGFLSAESYPIDDANTSNTSAITTQEIPLFTGTNGIKLDLRDCIDFRALKANTANSATIANNATINPSNTAYYDIPSGGSYAFTPDQEFTTDFSYYVGRIDKLYVDTKGNIGVKEGIAAISPRTPSDKQNSMTLAVLDIPPYPSLPYNLSVSYKRPDYAVNLSVQQTKRFTMKDIGTLEQRVNRLEYYTTLSLLETATKQMKILDGSGNDRFKNGFLVDSFNDILVSDTDSVEFQNFSPGYDFENSEIVPRQMINWIDLMISPGSNTAVNTYDKYANNKSDTTNKITMLSADQAELFSQPYASKLRKVSEGTVFTFKGGIILDPPGNHRIDVTTNPALTADLAALGNVKVANHVLIGSSYRVESGISGIETNISAEVVPSQASKTFSTGNYIQDINITPYLDPILVKFYGFALKPNTIVYPFFDNVNVSIFCRQTSDTYTPTGTYGGQLKTDSTGSIYGLFYLPKGIFLSGERIFKLIDVINVVTSSDVITSEAAAIFFGSNIDISKSSLNIQSQPNDINLSSTLTKTSLNSPISNSPTIIPPTQYQNGVVSTDQQQTYLINSQATPPTATPEIDGYVNAAQISYSYAMVNGADSPGYVTFVNLSGSADVAWAYALMGVDVSGWTQIPDGYTLPDGTGSEGG